MLGHLVCEGVSSGGTALAVLNGLIDRGHSITAALRSASSSVASGGGGADRGTAGSGEAAVGNVGPYSSYDPRVSTPTDPPQSLLRVRLSLSLARSAARGLVRDERGRRRLLKWSARLQRYLFIKPSVPADVR